MHETGKNQSGHLPGVGCSVIGCKYHSTDNCCTAECIDVKNENAIKKAETFCGTFAPRGTM